MIYNIIFMSLSAVFALISTKFYPEWTWLPQTPEQAILEGIVILMFMISVLVYKVERYIEDQELRQIEKDAKKKAGDIGE